MVKLTQAHRSTIATGTAPTHWYRANCQGITIGYAASVTPGKWHGMVAPTKGTTLAVLVARAKGLGTASTQPNTQAIG